MEGVLVFGEHPEEAWSLPGLGGAHVMCLFGVAQPGLGIFLHVVVLPGACLSPVSRWLLCLILSLAASLPEPGTVSLFLLGVGDFTEADWGTLDSMWRSSRLVGVYTVSSLGASCAPCAGDYSGL